MSLTGKRPSYDKHDIDNHSERHQTNSNAHTLDIPGNENSDSQVSGLPEKKQSIAKLQSPPFSVYSLREKWIIIAFAGFAGLFRYSLSKISASCLLLTQASAP